MRALMLFFILLVLIDVSHILEHIGTELHDFRKPTCEMAP
jgi:hypothetical protein